MAEYGPDFMGFGEDRERIEAMFEIEREMLISDRRDELEELEGQRDILRKRYGKAKPMPTKISTRTKKPKIETQRALDQIAKRATRQSDSDEDSPDRKPPPKKPAVEPEATEPEIELATLEDMCAVQVVRIDLEKWVNEAYFEEVVKGLFVRFSLGPKRKTGIAEIEYCIAEIVDVKEREKYESGAVKTNKWLELQFGDTIKMAEIKYVSNKPFAAVEYEKWVKVLETHRKRPPKKNYVASRKNFKETAQNFVYTESDVSKVLEYKRKLKDNESFSANRRAELLNLVEVARDSGNQEEYRKYADMLDALDKQQRVKVEPESYGISKINANNKRKNQMVAVATVVGETGQKDVFDPFERRPTRPSFALPASAQALQSEPEKATEKPPESPSESPQVTANNRAKVLDEAKKIKRGFDFELELDQAPPAVPALQLSGQPKPPAKAAHEGTGAQKKISLADYLKKK
eukprot:c14808_g1_i3.p1 GENE.c14808_g1_i3~~c14808_g1_i3.p1  ORF type:complete len:462 (-),score=124.20 c14808_g1_i3:59-1444(-)